MLVTYQWKGRLYYAHVSQPSREGEPCPVTNATPLAVVDDGGTPRVLSSEDEPLLRVLWGGIGGGGGLAMGLLLTWAALKLRAEKRDA